MKIVILAQNSKKSYAKNMTNPKPIVIGNWKMNKTVSESKKLAQEIVQGAKEVSVVEAVICPSYPSLNAVAGEVGGTEIGLGSQNVFWKEEGAYTGEVSIKMLKDLGVTHVLVGHSERRINFHETDEEVNEKMRLVIDYGLIPILCVGEKFEERQKGQKDVVIMQQVASGLRGIDSFRELIIAYEPVWVIGRGEAIDPEDARASIDLITFSLRDLFSQQQIEENVRLIYGGSVDPTNAAPFVDMKTIHGLLVGGSSLKSDKFLGILKAIKPKQ